MPEQVMDTKQFSIPIAVAAEHQVNVYVRDPAGNSLPNCKVMVYRAVNVWPFTSEVAYTVTDSAGYAYFDGLLPWFYALAAEHEERRLSAPPKMFTVPVEVIPPYSKFTFTLKATPPPHLYEVRINFGLAAIAEAAGWVAGHLPQLTEAVAGAGGKFIRYYTSNGWLVIQFRVEATPTLRGYPIVVPIPHWLVVVAAILAILIVLAIIGWEIREVVGEVPPEVLKWGAIAVVVVASVAGGGYALSRIKR